MPDNVLLFSQRQISRLVAFCLSYEFEDTIAAVTESRRIDATDIPALEMARRTYKLARLASGSSEFARRIAPKPRNALPLEQDYELFFPVFSHSYEVHSLFMLANWRQRCKKAVCFINEIGSEALPKNMIELLSEFDHIFFGTRHGMDDTARITGRPCTYLPLAVDVLRFTPNLSDPSRPIDVCNIGRRSPVTHEALLDWSDRKQGFYYFDTVAASGAGAKDRTFSVDNPQEHRRMLAALLKRSRYMIANRSHVNKPAFAAVHHEISSRFYEGAAAGAIMIGEPPGSAEFKSQFDWPDAVINTPFNAADIGQIIDELDNDPERLQAIRRNTIREAALRHDWLYRLQTVFDIVGLPHTEKMRLREQQLKQIAARV